MQTHYWLIKILVIASSFIGIQEEALIVRPVTWVSHDKHKVVTAPHRKLL